MARYVIQYGEWPNCSYYKRRERRAGGYETVFTPNVQNARKFTTLEWANEIAAKTRGQVCELGEPCC